MGKEKRKEKKKSPARRALRAVKWLLIAAALFQLVGACWPFMRAPELKDEAELLARAEEMSRDVESADRAMLLETRAEALDERIRLMNLARRELVIAAYDCRDSESTRDVLCVALDRADAGVKVRMLVDGIAGARFLARSRLFRALEAHPNFELRFYNPPSFLTPWRHMGRMHDKYVIVDDSAYILGGRNMFDGFIGDYPAPAHSLDREALVVNSAVGSENSENSSLFQLRAYFEGMWGHEHTVPFPGTPLGEPDRGNVFAELNARFDHISEEKPELFQRFYYADATVPTSGVWLISNPTNIDAKQPVVFSQLCALMDRAKGDVVIHSPYAVLNDFMAGRLSAIAEKTPVTLMINAVENGANVVANSDYLYHRKDVLATGMNVLEYAGGESYHGKALAIDDDLSVIGSFNLDLRSAYVDTELMLVVRGQAFNALLRKNMEALHADCRRVTGDGTGEVPAGLTIAPLPLWKRAAMRALGAIIQLARNLV